MKKFTNTGSYIGDREYLNSKRMHAHDKKLQNALIDFLRYNACKTAADFGCGFGLYTEAINGNGILCDGYDGNPNTEEFCNDNCRVMDLSTKNLNLNKKYDWIVSLEVGEHIPEQYESNFIENIHNHNSDGVIISWAIEGQGGHGHVNNRNNDYIKDIFIKLGYVNDIEAELYLRKRAELPWFKKTIMVFNRFKNSFPNLNHIIYNKNDHGWFGKNHQKMFSYIVNKYDIHNMCELGSYMGKSSIFFASHIKENSKLYCVDLWSSDFIIHDKDNPYIDDQYDVSSKNFLRDHKLYDIFLSNTSHMKDKIVPLKTSTIYGIKSLHHNDIAIDLFYIDANHTYESVISEIKLIKKLYPNAIIFGDDYECFPGVRQAVEEAASIFSHDIKTERQCWLLE